jgi:membrane protease YdiL (CAAX protease family)
VSGFVACFHLFYFGLVLPIGGIKKRRRHFGQGAPMPSRLQHFRASVFSLTLFGCLSVLVAVHEGIALFPKVAPSWTAILSGLVMYLVCVAAMMPRWSSSVQKRSRLLSLIMSTNGTERGWWLAVSILAGVSEEITWRGVQVSLLTELTGHYWVAAVASAASFALAHSVQGPRSVLVILLFAIGFQFLVWLAGTLWVAMAVHSAYDITAGIVCERMEKRASLSTVRPD